MSAVALPKLRQARIARAWTQAEFARLAGVSVLAILKAEAGRPVRLSTAKALIGALELQPPARASAEVGLVGEASNVGGPGG